MAVATVRWSYVNIIEFLDSFYIKAASKDISGWLSNTPLRILNMEYIKPIQPDAETDAKTEYGTIKSSSVG